MDAVAFLVLNIEKTKFVDELPVASQVSVRGGTQLWSLGVGEVSLHVNERRDAVLVLVLPDLTHESSVEIRLAAEEWVDGRIAQEFGENDNLGGAIENRVQDSRASQGARHALVLCDDGRLIAERPPGVSFGEKTGNIGAGPHPRRVSHLEVEAAAGEDGGEVQLPVEEALGLRHLPDHGEPLVLVND